MSNIKLDLSKFKHISSDKKTTKLRHKDGHVLVLAHNALGKDTQKQLSALSKIALESATPEQADEMRGQKMAEGGEPRQRYADSNDRVAKPPEKDTIPQTDKTEKPIPNEWHGAKSAWENVKNAAAEVGIGTSSHAKGGEIKKEKPAGMSEQGLDTRHAHRSTDKQDKEMSQDFAKTEAMERAKFERKAIKPKMKGLAEGGPIKMAVGGTPYDQGLPCLNPHCKSHGKPHPNCRCYSMAEGGEALNLRYCAHGKPHIKGCEYLAEGGEVDNAPTPNEGVETPPVTSVPGATTPTVASDSKSGGSSAGIGKIIGMFLAEGGKVLPLYATGGSVRMAKGGLPEPVEEGIDAEDTDVDNEVNNNEDMGENEADPTRNIPGAVNDTLQGMSAERQPQSVPTPMPPEPEQPGIHRPDQEYNVQPVVDNSETPIQRFARSKQEAIDNNRQDLMKENAAWEQDLANGHITPKTYQSMFNDKGTLGKVGTLFGLLLSGAGSGLSGQSNAVLDMMNNEIQKDLTAQIQSKTNAKNFLTMNQEALMNKAGVRQIDTDNQVKAYALAQSQMLQSSYSSLAADVAKMPEGPAKEMAKQKLGMVYNAVGSKINNINDLATGAMSYYNTMFPQGEGSAREEVWQKDNWKKRMMGPQGEAIATQQAEKHIPGVEGEASNPIDPKYRDQVIAHNLLDNKINDVLSFAKKHANIKDQLSPAVIREGAQKAHELTSFYNKTVDNLGMTSGRMDWLDEQIKKNPQSIIQQLLGNNAALNEIRSSNTSRRDLLLKNLGFPHQPQTKPSGLQEGATSVDKNTGKPIIFRNGSWNYK